MYTCIYSCKEGPVHHIEVKKYKSAPHVSPLHSERSWNFFRSESEVYDFMRNTKGWGRALSFHTYDWRSEYNEGRLKLYTHLFIVAKKAQYIILKSKRTKALLMSVLYERSWNFFKCESEVYDFMRNIQRW